jgi:hypothetical protein
MELLKILALIRGVLMMPLVDRPAFDTQFHNVHQTVLYFAGMT